MTTEKRCGVLQWGRAKDDPVSIPWSIAEEAYAGYSAEYGRSQTLERMAERGGFGAAELDDYVPGWRERSR